MIARRTQAPNQEGIEDGRDRVVLTSALPVAVMLARAAPDGAKNQSETTDLASMSALWHGPARRR